MSSAIQTVKELLGIGEDGGQTHDYRCRECGTDFESAKRPERAVCTECLGQQVERRD